MRLIDPYAPFFTYKKIIAKYGGEYSFFEKLRLGGVGSPKVTYISGISEFDAIHYSEDLEQSMTNFELLKGGVIIRINKKQKLAVAIEKLELLDTVQLKTEIVAHREKQLKTGHLSIKFRNREAIAFEVGAAEYEGVVQFFRKKPFRKLFELR